METSWSRCGGRGEVSYAGEDPNIEVHDSTRCRGQSMRWQESVMFSDPDDTGRFGATGQYFGGQEWRGVRQQAAIKTIHSTSVSGGSAPGATNNRSIRRVCSAVGHSSQTADSSASFGSTLKRMKPAGEISARAGRVGGQDTRTTPDLRLSLIHISEP